MNATSSPETPVGSHVARRLIFLKDLQSVTNRIHATHDLDELMLDLPQDICKLFNADRLTLYVLADAGQSIVSRVKTGLHSTKDLKLPVGDQSIAGYVAANRKTVNIRDVYDDEELSQYSPHLQFLKEVDRRTGYRSRQMLVSPILDGAGELLGVVQLINSKDDQPFPAWAEEGVKELSATLAVALTQRQRGPQAPRSRYDGLVSAGVLAASELEDAHKRAREHEMDLESVLIQHFKVKPQAIGESLAEFFRTSYEPFKPGRIKPVDLLRNLKRDYLEESGWVPVEESPEGVVVLSPDPERVKNAKVVNNIYPKKKIIYRVTTHQEFQQVMDQFFGALSDLGSIGEMLSDMGDDETAGEGGGDDVSAAADNELVRLVNKIIVDACQQGASDIHVEPRPGKEKTLIRFRKDGSLAPYIEIPASFRAAMVTRIKIMCDLDISEKRRPQDGKIKFKKYGPLDIELRVATIPTAGGLEDVVMRILAAGEPIPLAQLGLSSNNYRNLIRCVEKPYGLFFVCGPTGSGKTTTLHSILGYLNKPDTKIWTAEDPVEITQKGLRQVQINKKAGLDFATIMRAFLRADPDIIMVGEMRDAETTSIGIEASLTGHLVLATLHTNSAPESIIRLLDMGMDPFNFADAMLGILAQRLGKRLCKECRSAYTPDEAEIEHLLDEYCDELRNTDGWRQNPQAAREAIRQEWQKNWFKDGKLTLYKARGCPACSDTGYKGRVGLHELLVGTDPVKKLIQEKARVAEVLACALNEGMRTLKMDGIEKVLQGITDLIQVRAVCIK